jgi:serine protein kinase
VGNLIAQIADLQDYAEFADLHWSGSFEEYLEIVRERPGVTRTAYQRLYDMILSWGTDTLVDNKKKLTHYRFFDDPMGGGREAVFGLDIPLMRLVNVIKSAAMGYGAEKRVILLHGPVGSSKSTIARLLKRGIEAYSRKPEGALYTYEWILPEHLSTSPAARPSSPAP